MKKKMTMLLAAALLLGGCSLKSKDAEPQEPTADASSKSDEKKDAKIVLKAAKTSCEAGDKVNISVQVSPADLSLSTSDFQTSGGSIEAGSTGIVFSAKKAGSYQIQAVKDGVRSNTISIQVNESDKKDTSGKDKAKEARPEETASPEEKLAQAEETAKNEPAGEEAVVTVDAAELLNNPSAYAGLGKIRVTGNTPSKVFYDENGNPYTVIYPSGAATDGSSAGVVISGTPFAGNSGNGTLTGNFQVDDKGQYYFTVDTYLFNQEPAPSQPTVPQPETPAGSGTTTYDPNAGLVYDPSTGLMVDPSQIAPQQPVNPAPTPDAGQTYDPNTQLYQPSGQDTGQLQ